MSERQFRQRKPSFSEYVRATRITQEEELDYETVARRITKNGYPITPEGYSLLEKGGLSLNNGAEFVRVFAKTFGLQLEEIKSLAMPLLIHDTVSEHWEEMTEEIVPIRRKTRREFAELAKRANETLAARRNRRENPPWEE